MKESYREKKLELRSNYLNGSPNSNHKRNPIRKREKPLLNEPNY